MRQRMSQVDVTKTPAHKACSNGAGEKEQLDPTENGAKPYDPRRAE